MNVKKCCFAGHSLMRASEELKEKIYNKCIQLIEEENVLEFWVGNYGKF